MIFGDFGSLFVVAAEEVDDVDDDAVVAAAIDDEVVVDDDDATVVVPFSALNCSTCFITRTRTPIGMPKVQRLNKQQQQQSQLKKYSS